MKTWPLLSLIFLLTFCKDTQIEDQKNILGTWEHVAYERGPKWNSSVNLADDFRISGLKFLDESHFENKDGYIDYSNDNEYKGLSSSYKIFGDSISLYSPLSKKWNSYRIFALNTDSLAFGNDYEISEFKRLETLLKTGSNATKIVLSSSGCFGFCPVMSVLISSDGEVSFYGQLYTTKKGLYKGKLSKQRFQDLRSNFLFDISKLGSQYTSPVSDGNTISTTFVETDSIYKTVDDYRNTAPRTFTWGYVPLQYLYQQLKLKKIEIPAHLRDVFTANDHSSFIKGKEYKKLPQSETFLLLDYFRKGKISDHQFAGKFNCKFQSFYGSVDVLTDGRFYQLVNTKTKKSVTVDIGFNFYDQNLKGRAWRTLEE